MTDSGMETIVLRDPFPGVEALKEGDEQLLTGRDDERTLVTSHLLTNALTVVYGASGVGKTSLLLAGVVPELKQRTGVAVVVFRDWQDDDYEYRLRLAILEELHRAINFRLETVRREKIRRIEMVSRLVGYLASHGDAEAAAADTHRRRIRRLLAVPLHQLLASGSAVLSGQICFVLDQLEEYFLRHPPNDFDRELAIAVNSSELHTNFLFSLRDDGLSKIDRLHSRIPSLLGNLVRIRHLTRPGALDSIKQCVKVYNGLVGEWTKQNPECARPVLTIEESLIERLLDDAAPASFLLERESLEAQEIAGRVAAARMQILLSRLWDDAENRLVKGEATISLTVKRYRELGGADDILQSFVNERMEARRGNLVSPDPRSSSVRPPGFFTWRRIKSDAARILPYLITDTGSKVSRTIADLKQLFEGQDFNPSEKRITVALEKLVDLGLIRKPSRRTKGRPESRRYEIIHDALGSYIRDWCESFRATERIEQMRWTAALVTVAIGALIVAACFAINKNQKTQRAIALQRNWRTAAEALERADRNDKPFVVLALGYQSVQPPEKTPGRKKTLLFPEALLAIRTATHAAKLYPGLGVMPSGEILKYLPWTPALIPRVSLIGKIAPYLPSWALASIPREWWSGNELCSITLEVVTEKGQKRLTPKVWLPDLENNYLLSSVPIKSKGLTGAIAMGYNPALNRFAICTLEGKIYVWDVVKRTREKELENQSPKVGKDDRERWFSSGKAVRDILAKGDDFPKSTSIRVIQHPEIGKDWNSYDEVQQCWIKDGLAGLQEIAPFVKGGLDNVNIGSSAGIDFPSWTSEIVGEGYAKEPLEIGRKRIEALAAIYSIHFEPHEAEAIFHHGRYGQLLNRAYAELAENGLKSANPKAARQKARATYREALSELGAIEMLDKRRFERIIGPDRSLHDIPTPQEWLMDKQACAQIQKVLLRWDMDRIKNGKEMSEKQIKEIAVSALAEIDRIRERVAQKISDLPRKSGQRPLAADPGLFGESERSMRQIASRPDPVSPP